MSILSWNCRGIGQPEAVQSLRSLLGTAKPNIVFLMETKGTKKQMGDLRVALGFDSGLFVERRRLGGGLALLWDAAYRVEVKFYSSGHIDAWVTGLGAMPWRFTGFYGSPYAEQKSHSWNLLRRLSGLFVMPWLCVGDFNQVLYSYEKVGGQPANINRMIEFQSVLSECELSDLGYKGNIFTWPGKYQGNEIRERLDRALANPAWAARFKSVMVENLVASHSDHAPVHVQLNQKSRTELKWSSPPRFDPFWLQDEDCCAIFENHWRPPSTIAQLPMSTEDIRNKLSSWSSKKHGNLRKKVQQATEKLKTAVLGNSSSIDDIKRLQRELGHWEAMEETYWHQRARANWLAKGDRNTSYFHHKANARREQNFITRTCDEMGRIAEDERVMKWVINTCVYYCWGLPSSKSL